MEGTLWKAYSGHVELGALQRWAVIDRCAASVGDITCRVGSGGVRIYGSRPLSPEPSLIQQQRGFFEDLKASLQAEGQKLPILVWGINGKLYVRYGASRVWAAKQLGWSSLRAVLCSFDKKHDYEGFSLMSMLEDATDILVLGFGSPSLVGDFECSHERLDAHRMVP